jgi:hypothetical protein
MWQSVFVWILVVAALLYTTWALLPPSLRALMRGSSSAKRGKSTDSTADACGNCPASAHGRHKTRSRAG